MSTETPTRQQCIDEAAEVIFAAAVRIETERRDAWLALPPARRKQLHRTVYGCWIPNRQDTPSAQRRCAEPRCVYPPHQLKQNERTAA